MDRTIYVKTTESCNLNCKHCFTGGNGPERTFIDTDRFRSWVNNFTQYIDPYKDYTHFELHGGEPFLAPLATLKKVTQAIRIWGPTGSKRSIGATTNLVYKLTDELLAFIRDDIDFIATSWDPEIRFANEGQRQLWWDNLKKLQTVKPNVVLNVSVSKKLVQMDQEELLLFLRDTGCYKVQFDRITLNGNANLHPDLFPSNAEINKWYLDMHEASERLAARDWFRNAALEDVYAKFESGNTCSGTFCRDCEEKIFTLNVDGTIGGCANSAPEESFGHMGMSMRELFEAPKRIDAIVEERVRNDNCYTCPVSSYCGSDCHRLSWEGDVCASPRQLMKKLAGLPYDDVVIKHKKFIPIFSA